MLLLLADDREVVMTFSTCIVGLAIVVISVVRIVLGVWVDNVHHGC